MQVHDAVWLRHRQWAKSDRVEQRKERRVRPDAQREGEHGYGGEAGILQQLAAGEAKVVHINVWRSGPRSDEDPISKDQAPKKSQFPNPKHQTTRSRRCLVI